MFVLKATHDREIALLNLRLQHAEANTKAQEAIAHERGASVMFLRGQLQEERDRCDKLMEEMGKMKRTGVVTVDDSPIDDPPTVREADKAAAQRAREARQG